ncbi:lactonase family protein [Actinophytocola sp.]|uniref:lactonase family protein n=1 Tax=Actinophytocola sp. TaxID=1872138 RepID=UPI002D810A6A|nr:lactonase family protein [Actinophytocola sp.]HET9139656.1 lactonase family protein [Actinophytocola sp.]
MYLGSFAACGLWVGRVHPGTGELTVTGAVPDVAQASFLACALDRRTLYTTNELSPDGTVTALDLADPARPVPRNRQPTGGAAPTHLSVHTSGRFLLTANYGDPSVAVHRLEPDGAIGECTDRAGLDGHAHQVLTDPSGRWVLAVDLGADTVHVYRLNPADGTLTARDRLRLQPGFGPRHLAFHPYGRFLYILGELRPEIAVAGWDAATGRLDAGPVLATAAAGDTFPAELTVCRDGRFVYATNRGENTVAVLGTRDDGAGLVPVGAAPTGGDWPRHLALGPDERWLYVCNQRSGTVTQLPRDPTTGLPGAPVRAVPVPDVAVLLFH